MIKAIPKEQRLLVFIFIGIIAGVLVGGIGGENVAFLQVFGDLFLRALKMVVIPLVITSIVTGVVQLGDPKKLGLMGGLTVGYYLATTMVSVTLGLVLVNLIQPGVGAGQGLETPERLMGKQTTLTEMILSFIPENVVGAAANAEILPLIFFSIFFGLMISSMREKGKILIDFFEALNEAIMGMVHVIIWFSPIGIGCLIAGKLAEMDGFGPFLEELAKIGAYAFTVILGLALHALFLAALLKALAKRNPIEYGKGVLKALANAFATASSSATLPLTIDCVEKNNKVSPKAAGFVLPLGATVNMDGTALYEAVAALFVAQAYGINLTLEQQIIIAVTATFASIGAAGIPEAGLVMLVIVFQAVDLPLEGISMLLIIDWFLDRFRTTVNVWGDSIGAAVIERIGLGEEEPHVEPSAT